MAKQEKRAKKLKDLDPKAKAKSVKGGWRRDFAGNAANKILDRGVNRTLNPR